MYRVRRVGARLLTNRRFANSEYPVEATTVVLPRPSRDWDIRVIAIIMLIGDESSPAYYAGSARIQRAGVSTFTIIVTVSSGILIQLRVSHRLIRRIEFALYSFYVPHIVTARIFARSI
jgi:hypothetical protein